MTAPDRLPEEMRAVDPVPELARALYETGLAMLITTDASAREAWGEIPWRLQRDYVRYAKGVLRRFQELKGEFAPPPPAPDELTRLREEQAELLAALEPFARRARHFDSTEWGPRTSDSIPMVWSPEHDIGAPYGVTMGDLRRAAALHARLTSEAT